MRAPPRQPPIIADSLAALAIEHKVLSPNPRILNTDLVLKQHPIQKCLNAKYLCYCYSISHRFFPKLNKLMENLWMPAPSAIDDH